MIFASKEDQYWATRESWEGMADFISKNWDEGLIIMDLTYGQGMYYVLMAKYPGISSQEYQWKKTLPSSPAHFHEEADGKCITSIMHDGSSYCFVRTELEHKVEQVWTSSRTFPKAVINQHWKQGYSLSLMVWAKEQWLAVFSRPLDYAIKEAWQTRLSLKPRGLKKKLQQDGRVITSLCYGDGKWALSYARHPAVNSQDFYYGKDFPESEISEYWEKEYDVSKAVYGDGMWLVSFISTKTEMVAESPLPVRKNKKGTEVEWKQQLARKEQQKRKSEMESKQIKL